MKRGGGKARCLLAGCLLVSNPIQENSNTFIRIYTMLKYSWLCLIHNAEDYFLVCHLFKDFIHEMIHNFFHEPSNHFEHCPPLDCEAQVHISAPYWTHHLLSYVKHNNFHVVHISCISHTTLNVRKYAVQIF